MKQQLFLAIAVGVLLGGCQPTTSTPPKYTAAGTGKELYEKYPCSGCHNIGAGGAPILGVRSAWAERIKKGPDALTQSVIRGMSNMPPRGATALSDAEIRMIVEYMMEKGR